MVTLVSSSSLLPLPLPLRISKQVIPDIIIISSTGTRLLPK